VKTHRYALSSVDNVLALLLAFRAGRPIRVTDASAQLGVSRSTAHRLLITLEQRGFVRQDQMTRAYLVGDALVELGRTVTCDPQLESIALPAMERLARRLGETIHLGILDGTNTRYLACVESAETLRTGSHVGTSFPAHRTACGKALLAELEIGELRSRYAHEKLAPSRRGAIASWNELLRALEHVRKAGYATNFEESENGVNALAVVIRRDDGTAFGALTLTGPSLRLKRYKMKAYARELEEAATQIRANLARREREGRRAQPKSRLFSHAG
jgi:DNA-binding IclR family transcriptional regulator